MVVISGHSKDAAGGISPVAPSALTGLIAWWDAQNSVVTFSSGIKINTVSDMSGNGNTISVALFAYPEYRATGFNTSYPSFTMTGGGYLRQQVFPMGTGSTLTAWWVGNSTGSSEVDSRALSYAAPTNTDMTALDSWTVARSGASNASINLFRNSTITPVVAATCNNLLPTRVIVTIDSGGVQKLYVDGVATTGSTISSAWATGGDFAFGGQAAGLLGHWDGPVAEAGVASGFTDAAHVAGLDLYLQAKWGL